MVNWKKEIINDLRDYPYQKNSLVTIPEQIQALESQYQALKSAMSGNEPVSGGTSQSEDHLISNICKRESLEHNYSYVSRAVSIIDKALEVLDDNERKTIECMYIDRHHNATDTLITQLNASQSAIYRYKDTGLAKLVKSIYGIEKL